MQLYRNAAALLILRRNHAGGQAAQLTIQGLQLLSLAVQLQENTDFGAQYLRNDRNRNIVHRPLLVPPEPVQIG